MTGHVEKLLGIEQPWLHIPITCPAPPPPSAKPQMSSLSAPSYLLSEGSRLSNRDDGGSEEYNTHLFPFTSL